MRFVRLTGQQQVELVDGPEPIADEGSVVVEILRCSIGGPDMEAYQTGELVSPAWFGHEWVGKIVEVGANCPDRFVGERVVGSAPLPCGECAPCRSGLFDYCDLVLEMILGTDELASDHGAFAERIRVDHRRVRRVPEGVDIGDAAMAEPVAVAVHGVGLAEQKPGDLVVVIGGGTIGLICVQLARLSGAARVALIDQDPDRRELGCDLGADAAFGSSEPVLAWLSGVGHEMGADVVFDCSGAWTSLRESLAVARRGGTVVAIGVSTQSSELTSSELITSQVTIKASCGYSSADGNRSLDLIAEERLVVDRLYEADPISLDEFPDLMSRLASTPLGRIKYQIAPALDE